MSAGARPSGTPHAGPDGATAEPRRPGPLALVAAFAAIYFIWGSTYLGIKVAIEAMPPFFMAGARFTLAGAILLGWLLLRGRAHVRQLSRRRLGLGAVVGILMLGIGNGLAVLAILRGAATGLVAVLIAITPFWLVGIERIMEPSRRIRPRVIAGLVLGVAGIAVLGGLERGGASGAVDGLTLVSMVVATLAWACGSMLSRFAGRRLHEGADALLAPAIQMLGGGVALLLVSALVDRWGNLDLGAITLRSWIGFVYLVLCGSIIAYSAFIWLLRHVSAAAVGTYAYVNPIVAVLLGTLVLGEPITLRTAVASALILAAVGLAMSAERSRASRAAPQPPAPEPVPLEAVDAVPSDGEGASSAGGDRAGG